VADILLLQSVAGGVGFKFEPRVNDRGGAIRYIGREVALIERVDLFHFAIVGPADQHLRLLVLYQVAYFVVGVVAEANFLKIFLNLLNEKLAYMQIYTFFNLTRNLDFWGVLHIERE